MIVSLVSRQCDLFSVAFFGIPQAEETRQGPYMPLIIHHWSVMLCPVSGITRVGMQKVTIFNWAADQGIDWTAFTSSNELVWADGEGSAWKLGVNQDGSDDRNSKCITSTIYLFQVAATFISGFLYLLSRSGIFSSYRQWIFFTGLDNSKAKNGLQTSNIYSYFWFCLHENADNF
jgi:hypothetical protein